MILTPPALGKEADSGSVKKVRMTYNFEIDGGLL
jgi:hypothetical protein